MERNELIEYLGIVVDMEKNILMQNKMMKDVRDQLSTPENEHNNIKAERPIEPAEPAPFGLTEPKERTPGRVLFILLVLGLIADGLGLSVVTNFNSSASKLGVFFGFIIFAIGLVSIVWCASTFLGETSAIAEYHEGMRQYQTLMEQYQKDKEEYKRELTEYQLNIAAEEKRLQQEVAEKEFLNTCLRQIEEQNAESMANLEKIYATNIVFPKYRNLAMICSLYEYISAGRCTELGEAYNILELEMRLDRIITQWDRILKSLATIQQNQIILYGAIQESNRRAEKIYASTQAITAQLQSMQAQSAIQGVALTARIEQMQKASELSAYHTERVQKELAYMNRMNYFAGRNDGTFFNLPPT